MELIFDKIFERYLNEGSNAIIEYKHEYFTYDDTEFISFKILSVNSNKSEEEYKNYLMSISKKCIHDLHKHIQNVSIGKGVEILEDILNKFKNIRIVVNEDKYVEEESEYDPRQEDFYNTFTNAQFIGTKDTSIDLYKESILRKAQYYAEEWINVYDITKNKIEFLINQLSISLMNTEQNKEFVSVERIENLKQISSITFDLSKLIRFCEEINISYNFSNYYSCILIIRAIIDHIPPIFNKPNFQEVANNYGTKSFKDSMLHLDNSSRKIADSVLHTQIRKKEILVNKIQINFSNDLDLLLSEIIRVLK